MMPVNPIAQADSVTQDRRLRTLAGELEAQFLAEMLKSSGLGKPRDAMGGGIGEEQFSGLLAAEYAHAAVEAGGIGLSEAIYNALVRTGART